MTALDVADVVVIAATALGLPTDAALAQIDMPAAEAALVEAALPAAPPNRVGAAAACTRLVHALLREPPFPGYRLHVATAAGLQYLAVNGWEADLKSALAPHGAGGAGMFVGGRMLARFSDGAAAALLLARDEARRLGQAVKALNRVGVNLETLRRQVEDSIGHGEGVPAGPIRPSGPRGQKVLNSALPEALADGAREMGTGHMLLAQFHDDGPAAQALARHGADEETVRAAIAAELAQSDADHRGHRKTA
jgi:hypothetical protein